MSLYRIQEKLYNKPWLIKPSMLHAMVTAFEAHIKGGKSEIPLPTEEDEEEKDEIMPEMELKSSIAVIPVDGVIGKHLSLMEMECGGGVDLDNIAAALKEARDDVNVDSILLWFNTPGGTVTGVKETAELIAEIDAIKPVYGFCDTLVASAGIWLASQCRALFVTPSSDIGSVGVYSLILDETRAYENAGIKVNAISAGKYKLMGASFKPLSEEERAMFQKDVDKIYKDFKAAILSKRDVDEECLQGQCFNGEDAVSNNLADGLVTSMDEVLEIISTRTK